MKSISIKAKLFIGAFVAASVMVVLLAVNAYSLKMGTNALSSVYENQVVPTSALEKIDTELKEIRFRMAAYLIDQMPAVGNRNQLHEARRIIASSWEQYKINREAENLDENYLRYAQTIENGIKNANGFFNKLDNAYAEDELALVTPLLEDEWPYVIHVSLIKPIEKLLPLQRAEVKSTYDHHVKTGRTLLYIESTILALVMAIFFASRFSLFKKITNSLSSVADAAEKIAAGNMEIELDTSADDEIGIMARAIDHMRREVDQRQRRLEAILENAAEGVITLGEGGIISSFNNAAQKLFGLTEEQALGTQFCDLIYPEDIKDQREGYVEHFLRHEIEKCIDEESEVSGRHSDGAKFHMALKVSKIVLDGKLMYTALVSDISERMAMMEHLKVMAEKDGLTGLYNRTYFQEQLENAVERAHRSGHTHALLYLDLDNFKYVNDTMSHAAGDSLLIEVSSLLVKRARNSDLISRFGGDEFTVLLYDADPTQAVAVAESFREKLANYTFRYGGESAEIGCSIGIAIIDENTVSAESALSNADLACHLAKRAGRNRVHQFEVADVEKTSDMALDMGWTRRIKKAIENNEFALACQPIVNTATREVECYEVLIRMVDENGELVMPGGFLPSAERFGLAVDIDKWVIVNSIRMLTEQRGETPHLRYSINLSGQTLSNLLVCKLIEDTLKETGLDPAALTFEVTETVAIADMSAAQVFLAKLQSIGCRTALDDFGTGMSSFAYLRDLPVNEVKIDGRFVKDLASNPVDRAMVRAMNDIAHALGKKTVAEFVENEESFVLLRQFGVDYGQGYHLGRPAVVVPCKAISEKTGRLVSCVVPKRTAS